MLLHPSTLGKSGANRSSSRICALPLVWEREQTQEDEQRCSGARLTTGGRFSGPFYRPTVLANVTPGMAAYDNEIFGPVAPVVTFSSMDEVVALARSTEYGLSLGILSKDVMKAMELAERIPSGLVHINDQTINDEPFAPFGGVGSSGNGGRLGGVDWNIEAFTETQWVTMRGEIAPHQLWR